MRTLTLVATAILVLGAGAARAEGEGEPRPRRGLREELGLSDQQAADLARLRGEERKAALRRRAEIQVARQELRDLLTAPTLDDQAVATKVRHLSDLRAAAVRARADGLIAMRRLLSPEQIETLSRLPSHRPRRALRRGALTRPEVE